LGGGSSCLGLLPPNQPLRALVASRMQPKSLLMTRIAEMSYHSSQLVLVQNCSKS